MSDTQKTKISVVLVDDDALVRSALELMVGASPNIDVVGQAADGAEGLKLITRLQPDVVLMDIRMPVMDGLAATTEIVKMISPPRVIVLTTFDADSYVVSAVGAGADGFLLKDTPPAEIVDAIERVADGEAMMAPSATRALIASVRENRPSSSDEHALLDTLTDRERDVAIAVSRGLSNAEIAEQLYISLPTVKSHVSKLFEKLGTANRVQVALMVYDAGLL